MSDLLRFRCEKCGRVVGLSADEVHLEFAPYGERRVAHVGMEPVACPFHPGATYWLVPETTEASDRHLRAAAIAARDHYPVHITCGGEVMPERRGGYFCHGCDAAVGDVMRPIDARDLLLDEMTRLVLGAPDAGHAEEPDHG